MDDFLRSLLLVFCGLGALVLLIVTYLWYFVFGRSIRGVLMAGLSILLNRDSRIDINADVVVEKRPSDAKKEIPQEVASLDFGDEVASSSQYVPQVEVDDFSAYASDAPPAKQDLVVSAFGEGRFRRISNAVSRPFLKRRIPQIQDDMEAQNVQTGQENE